MKWHQAALPTISTKEFSVTWYDFSRGFEQVRYPAGVTLKEILGDIDLNTPIPDKLSALGFGPRESHLFLICQRLQTGAGTGPFFLSSRQAGELLGIHFTAAAKMLATFVTDGLLKEVQKGAGGKASRYLVIPESTRG